MGCSSLSSINIPRSVTEISPAVFCNCSALTSVVIPENILEIPYSTFAACSSLASIKIPDNIKKIGNFAFSHCSSLSSISIPASADLGEGIFTSCKALSSITITQGSGEMGNWSFEENYGNYYEEDYGDYEENYSDYEENHGNYEENYGNYEENWLVKSVLSGIPSLETIIVPEGVKYISNNAFCYCESLSAVVLPSSVKIIGSGAFEGCTELKSITMPIDVRMGESVFKGCKSLSSFTLMKGIEEHSDNTIFDEHTSIKSNIPIESENNKSDEVDSLRAENHEMKIEIIDLRKRLTNELIPLQEQSSHITAKNIKLNNLFNKVKSIKKENVRIESFMQFLTV